MNELTLLNTIFVVEGKNDAERLAQIGIPYVIITEGNKVSRETIEHLQQLEKKHTIVILTDPDGPGNKISEKLQGKLSSPAILSVPKGLARHKKDIGIEHLDIDTLKELCAPYVNSAYKTSSNITYVALINLNLTGPGSKTKRMKITKALGIPYGPLHKMYKAMLLLDITLETVIRINNE